MNDEDYYVPIFETGKRCGLARYVYLDGTAETYTSYSPRAKESCAEGTWEEWAELAAASLADKRSKDAFPELHEAAKKALNPKGRWKLS